MSEKKTLLSGIQPSGMLNIGNYIGAIKNWDNLQKDHDCFFFLADLHTITVRQNPKELLERCYDFLALYIACGIDPEKNTIFVQSHVSGHSQLAWILNCYAMYGDLGRMTQFKDKSAQHGKNINAGLFSYPVLMAADILLYNTALVPVGQDQKQHLELARDLAQRFNNIYGDIFTVPEPYTPKVGARIMSLQDPESKMSKSDTNANNMLSLLDSPKALAKKVKKAVTDSGSEIRFDEKEKPAISNLMTIRSVITGETFSEMETAYADKGYGHFKVDLADTVVEFLSPVQARYKELREDETLMSQILKRGAQTANERAEIMLKRIHDALGFIPAL